MKKLLVVLMLMMVLCVQGCALIGTAASLAAAYGLSQAFD